MVQQEQEGLGLMMSRAAQSMMDHTSAPEKMHFPHSSKHSEEAIEVAKAHESRA